MPAFDPALVRPQFPALAALQDGRPVVFLDGPGGTQVPQRVIDAVAGYYRETNANVHGAFATSVRSDAILEEAHAAVADLLGAASPAEVKFGQNMTSLTFALSRAIARVLRPGDEVVISRLDHEANRGPWMAAAADAGRGGARDRRRPGHLHARPGLAGRRPLGANAAGGGRAGLQRGGHDQPGGRDRAPGARGRGLGVRGRGPLRAARPARRGRARRRLPGLLGLQVLRAARGDPVGAGGAAGLAAGLQGPAGSGPLGDRHAEPRGDRRDAGRGGVPGGRGRAVRWRGRRRLGRRARVPSSPVPGAAHASWRACGRSRRTSARCRRGSWPGLPRSPA